jgi:hypothetical protein
VEHLADTAIYLNLIALIPPAVGLSLLLKEKARLHGAKAATAVQIDLYFMGAISFDILVNLGFAWAAIGILFSVWLLLSSIGFLAASLCFCPEARSVRESLSKILRSASFLLYETTLLGWLIITVYVQAAYLPANAALWVAATLYPTLLFSLAKRRARTGRTSDTLKILTIAWLIQAVVALPTILFATGTSTLGIALPFGYQVAFLTSSLFYYFMSVSVTDPTWLSRLWVSRLVPQTIIELGRRYLVIHDTGGRTPSFLSNIFRNLVESGSRVIVKGRQSWLMETIAQAEPRFSEWVRTGKILNTVETPAGTPMHALSEKASFGKTPTVYVKSFEPGALFNAAAPPSEVPREKGQLVSELLLLESSKAPRPQLNEFLERNLDIQVLDLSEPKDYFSALVNLPHNRLQGSKILLEYDSGGDLGVVEKFLMEGIGYAEKCVLFTSKSSKLYRAIKGRELVEIVAASSLVSAPDELPDGEVQIPDRELGLVTSIASDLLENNRTSTLRFVFDSIEELIRGERWEQHYSGVKQLVELLNVPHATAIFLVNNGTAEPKFVASLKGIFPVQMRLDSTGLQVKKLGGT